MKPRSGSQLWGWCLGSIKTVAVEWKRSEHEKFQVENSRETDSVWDINSERCRKRDTFGRNEFQLYCFQGAGDGLDGGFFPDGSDGEGICLHAGDLGLIPGSGRSPGEGNGYPRQDYCLENPRGQRSQWPTVVHGVAKSRTWSSDSTSPQSEIQMSKWSGGCFHRLGTLNTVALKDTFQS